jgi:hypothetical protein
MVILKNERKFFLNVWLALQRRCQATALQGALRARTMNRKFPLVPETVYKMVIDHAGGLHLRIDDRRPDKLESALFQVFANGSSGTSQSIRYFVRSPDGALLKKLSPTSNIRRSF